MLQFCYRAACSIDMGQSVVITGGYNTKRTVTEYKEDGDHAEMPPLITGRYNHGCSSFMDSDNNMVRIISNIHELLKYLCRCYWWQVDMMAANISHQRRYS